jgi:hypothetical protein
MREVTLMVRRAAEGDVVHASALVVQTRRNGRIAKQAIKFMF